MSKLGELYLNNYRLAYNSLCGKPPFLRPWHFQWLAVRDLYADLRSILPQIRGQVLDVGCGDKPYGIWLRHAEGHIGIDVYSGPKVDVVFEPGQPWPIDDASYDVVLCTQVLEHVANLESVLTEIERVLKPKGLLVATVPFCYSEHGSPHDYRRLSVHGVRRLFEESYDVVEIKPQGHIGSTIGVLWLNWCNTQMNLNRATVLLRGMLLPVWVVFCGMVNAMGWLLDKLDKTDVFYGNVLIVARKRCELP